MSWRENVVRLLGFTVTPSIGTNAAVVSIPIGREDDGLVSTSGGSRIDKPWYELFQEFEDAREAWRKNPLARRLVGLVTSYVVGGGISLTSEKRHLQNFIAEFWQHNQMGLRVDEWCDELSRSGELFPVLFTNEITGMSSIRTVPASMIRFVEYDSNDYEKELRYQEVTGPGEVEKWWMGPGSDAAADSKSPLMLHYAVNRPTGAVRGESDLAPILPWLRRYNRWLEDRVRLNAAVRAFLWVIKAPARLRSTLEERYRNPPEPGTIIIAEEGAETWEAVTPKIAAGDAEKDGRAIRWMIVAGGPGTALLDIGEGEDSNLASGQAMQEQRRRFLRRRQAYLVWLLTDLTYRSYERWRLATNNRQKIRLSDITAVTPDISPEDNASLAAATSALTGSLNGMATLVGAGPTYRSMALRLFVKFAGETMSESEAKAILEEGEVERVAAQARQDEQMRQQQENRGGDGGK
jgi:broad specificity phosphatase PhoE